MSLYSISVQNIGHSFLVRKLLTRGISWWERHRQYLIRERVFLLPPIAVNPNPDSILAVLTIPGTLCDAAWAAYSLLRYLPSSIGLAIIVDGELPTDTIAYLEILFPGLILTSTFACLEKLRTIAPNVVQLGDYHPMGRKLATIIHFHQKYNLLYSDADVLCFREIPEVYKALSTNSHRGLYIEDIGEVQTEPIILEEIQKLGLDYARTINVGFLFIPHNSLAINIAEQLMKDVGDTITSWFPDTMILSVLMQQAEAEPLPKSRYVVSAQRQFYFQDDINYDKIAVRHFITPVRHLMYSKGMPRLWKELHEN